MAQVFVRGVVSGQHGMGLWWAKCQGWRVIAYARCGYSCHRWVDDDEGGDWRLLLPSEQMPLDIERALCAELGVPCKR